MSNFLQKAALTISTAVLILGSGVTSKVDASSISVGSGATSFEYWDFSSQEVGDVQVEFGARWYNEMTRRCHEYGRYRHLKGPDWLWGTQQYKAKNNGQFIQYSGKNRCKVY